MSRFGRAWRAWRETEDDAQAEWLSELKQSLAGAAVSGVAFGPRKIGTSYREFVDEGYSRQAAGFKAINDIAGSAASIPLHAYSRAGPKGERIFDHPYEQLLMRPNPGQAEASFVKELLVHHFMAGDYFVERIVPGTRARELYALRPDRMEVVPGADGIPSDYVFRVGSNTVHYPVDAQGRSDVLHVRLINPVDDWRGLSPLRPAARGIDTHNAATDWNLNSLHHGGRHASVLVVKGTTEKQRKQIVAEMEEKLTGVDNGRRMPVIAADQAEIKALGYTAVEMDWLTGKYQSAREICWALGYPSFLLGLPGDATYANQAAARLALWEQTVLPLFGILVAELNRWLSPSFGGVELRPFLDDIPALAPRREMDADRAKVLVTGGLATVNEGREMIGLPKRHEPEADELLIPAGLVPLGFSDEGIDELAKGARLDALARIERLELAAVA